MRIALIGARGQLGSDLLTALGTDAVALGHAEIEITRPDSVSAALDEVRPEVVINSAAYNLVDKAEEEPEWAYAVNALGPRNLARWCAAANVPLVHFSSDFVFSGKTARWDENSARLPLSETDVPDPQSAYAVSKLAGEHFVQAIASRHFIVRTCGLYGHRKSAGKGNFVDTMLRLGGERASTGQPLRVVDDHFCTPTFTVDLAAAVAELIRTDAWGLYHATNAGHTTWCRLAREALRLAEIDVVVEPTTSAQFAARAMRPAFSALDCGKLSRTIGRPLPGWEDALRRYLDGLSSNP